MVRRGPTNPELVRLIEKLKTVGGEQKAMVWLDVADKLSTPSRNRCEVNVSDIERHARAREKRGATNLKFVIPGKVLSNGLLSAGTVSVAALSFSKKAREKILSSGGACKTIDESMKEDPTGSGLIILG